MEHLHYEFDAGPDEVVSVNLDHAANVMLLDMPSYSSYLNSSQFQYYGGYITRSPYHIRPPRHGHWHLVVDLGGGAGTVRASVQIIPQATPSLG